MEQALARLSRSLKVGGVMYVSFKYGVAAGREEAGIRTANMGQGINDSPTQIGVNLELKDLVHDIAASIKRIDERRPQAANARTGAIYQPGIGPHPETQAVNLVVAELAKLASARYSERLHVAVSYPVGRQKCDLCIGNPPAWNWAVEIKMLRLMGDNGKPNDNMLMHILSPYPNDRSALTDCLKLANSGFSWPQGSSDLRVRLSESTHGSGNRSI